MNSVLWAGVSVGVLIGPMFVVCCLAIFVQFRK